MEYEADDEQYVHTILDRLKASGVTTAKRNEIFTLLRTIVRNIPLQSHECSKTAAELSDVTNISRSRTSSSLQLLERFGAIKRVKRGRHSKVIIVTPEGVLRGDSNNHAKTAEKYRFKVIDGGKS